MKSQQNRLDFSDIYENDLFEGRGASISGPGSTLEATTLLREGLSLFFKRYSINSILDLPCGDFNWMKEVNLSGVVYVGGDIVEKLIIANNEKYGPHRKFELMDLRNGPLPEVDVIFCRDCLVHLPYEDIFMAINTIKKSGSKYLLTTTFPYLEMNLELQGIWRALNLELPPFNFVKPIEIIAERVYNSTVPHSDKGQGLWRIKDLPSW